MKKFLRKKLFLATSLVSLVAHSSSAVLAMDDESDLPIITSSLRPVLETQSDINNVVSSTTKRVYAKINANWTYVPPGKGMKMSAESTMWDPLWIDGLTFVDGMKQEARVPTLVLKASPVNLIGALEDLIAKPASVECKIALTTAKIFCLREILGEEHFNLYTTCFYKLLATREDWTVEQFFHELPLQFLTTVKGKAIPGSITYITNILMYDVFKPHGNAQGENVFCTDQNEYLGFGTTYGMGPQPIETLEAEALRTFCTEEDLEGDINQFKRVTQKFDASPETFFQMRRITQDKIDSYQFFNLEEINNFMKTQEIYI
ncbi:MAG: hypothetical protein K2Y08_05395 [Alphaproteobacteria bacterium]|nr:hypothetical protein [Alphaproteobacteria bacterium]